MEDLCQGWWVWLSLSLIFSTGQVVLEMTNLGWDVARSVGYLPSTHEALGSIPAPNKTINVGAACLQSPAGKRETGGSEGGGYFQLPSEVEGGLGYTGLSLRVES